MSAQKHLPIVPHQAVKGQKQLLRQLAEQAADCFADAGDTVASFDEKHRAKS